MEDFERLLNDSSGEIIEILDEQTERQASGVAVRPARCHPRDAPARRRPLSRHRGPLTVERAASRRLLDELLPKGRLLGLSTQKDADLDVPGTGDLYEIGVLGNILRMVRQSDEKTLVLIQIVERIRLMEFVESKPYLKARFQILENKFPRPATVGRRCCAISASRRRTSSA